MNNNVRGFLDIDDRVNGLIRSESITDSYNVEQRPFARGKFATVRRCRHKKTNVDYAAKFIRKRRRAMDVRHEALHEIGILELSRGCARIVHLHEVFETSSEFVLVLELASGGELQRLIDEDEVLAEKDVVRLMRQILDGLIFLHDRHIAHLDLKPQNLLLTSAFPQGDVKLCDFGISRLIQNGLDIREIVGTPDYVAPEVLSYEPITLATDMWSVGVLVYVFVSGHSPFAGDTKQETFCNISRVNFDFPDDLFRDVSGLARDFMQKLLIKDPRQRMTARDCLTHPWLESYPPPQPFASKSPCLTFRTQKRTNDESRHRELPKCLGFNENLLVGEGVVC
uniref:non-specific serine/threonine protein kinase n=1 Tax=Strigamia maritima TaxID=126957 RepID=T1JCX8_STRMM